VLLTITAKAGGSLFGCGEAAVAFGCGGSLVARRAADVQLRCQKRTSGSDFFIYKSYIMGFLHAAQRLFSLTAVWLCVCCHYTTPRPGSNCLANERKMRENEIL
jgi:hypothetical protein